MTASSPSVVPTPVPPNAAPVTSISIAEIDESCRNPVLLLWASAALWLGIGALLELIAAIKTHAPGFLASSAWLTYGRLWPASLSLLVYGFALQAGLGAGLWILCRLGRSVLRGSWGIMAGGVLWNLGVLLGFGLILGGGSTGYEWLEMPRAATPILFSGYALIAAWSLVTLHYRKEQGLYPSQWFILAALLWFPWIYATAQVLLVFFPVRGVLQAVMDGWFRHNLFELTLAPLVLAVVFYFLPKLVGRALHSNYLVLFGFWLLFLFGSWGGVSRGEPVPSWLSAVSVVARVLMVVPVLAFALSWWRTGLISGAGSNVDPLLRFLWLAALSYLVTAALGTIAALPAMDRVVGFTVYAEGIAQLRIHGILAPALAVAVYYAVPRLLGASWPNPGWIRVHFWLAAIGVLLTVLPLVLGGIVQGSRINQPEIEFIKVVRSTVPFLGTSTLGLTLLWGGYLVFIAHLGRLFAVSCPCCASPAWLASIRPTNATGGNRS
jgi:cytochrome c oxidase cbb3-type subunit 1